MIIAGEYLSYRFCKEHKIRKETQEFITYLYKWIFSVHPPKYIIENNKIYFNLSDTWIAKYFNTTNDSISRKFRKLKELGFIHSVITNAKGHKKMKGTKFGTCHYVAFNWDFVLQSLPTTKEFAETGLMFVRDWKDVILKYTVDETYNKVTKESDMPNLLDYEDLNTTKKEYSMQSEAIVKKVISRHKDLFVTKTSQVNGKETKAFINSCKLIDEIYNGTFSRYKFSDKLFSNKQFNVTNWKERLNKVKSDWKEVKNLILMCADNFELMHNEDRVPFDKKYLVKDFSQWLLRRDSSQEYQSQLILSLDEPNYLHNVVNSKRIDKVTNEIKEKYGETAYKGCEYLVSLIEDKENKAIAWERTLDILKWGDLAVEYEKTGYWLYYENPYGDNCSGSSSLPYLYGQYLENNVKSISAVTLSINTPNNPWVWYLKNCIEEYRLKSKSLYLLHTKEDFEEEYKQFEPPKIVITKNYNDIVQEKIEKHVKEVGYYQDEDEYFACNMVNFIQYGYEIDRTIEGLKKRVAHLRKENVPISAYAVIKSQIFKLKEEKLRLEKLDEETGYNFFSIADDYMERFRERKKNGQLPEWLDKFDMESEYKERCRSYPRPKNRH